MADGKNIEIKIAATGGDQAAAEVRKVETAAKQLTNNPNASTGFGGMLEAGEKLRQEREKANAERLAQIEAEKAALAELAAQEKKALDAELDGMKEKEKASAAYAKKLDEDAAEKKAAARKKEIGLAAGAIGIAAGYAAKALSNVYAELEKVDTVELKKLDGAWAEQIDDVKKFKEALADPIGALAALANGGTTVKEAFTGMNEQMKLNAESMTDQVDRLVEKAKPQVEKIKKLADDIRIANELLAAKAETESAVQDGKDAEAIRNGADPDDVKAERAKKDAAAKIAQIEAEQQEPRAGLQQKFNDYTKAKADAEKARAAESKINEAGAKADATEKAYKERDPNASDDEVWALKKAAMDARNDFDYTKRTNQSQAQSAGPLEAQAKKNLKDFEEQKKAVADADALANQRKATIRQEADNKVRDFGFSKSERLKKEGSKREEAGFEAREQFQEYQKWKAEQESAEREAATATRSASGSLTQGAFTAAKDAKGMGAPSKGIAALEKAATNLSKNPDSNEAAAATEILLERVVAWLESNGKGETADTAKIRALERRFEDFVKKGKNDR